MKTKLFILLSCMSIIANAQSFKSGQLDINLGYGFSNTFIDSKYDVTLPALSASLDLGISDAISLGVYIGLASATWTVHATDVCNNGNGNGSYSYHYVYTHEASYTMLAARLSYHLITSDRLDGYAGLQLGNNFESDEHNISTEPFCDKLNKLSFDNKFYDGFIWSVYGGARFRFTDNISVFGELGYGIVVFNAGLNIKF